MAKYSVQEREFGVKGFSKFEGSGTRADPYIRVVEISGDGGMNISVDDSTESLQTITYAHHEIHSGSSYVTTDVQNVDTTTMKWQVTAPNSTTEPHVLFNITCTGEMSVTITEGSDRTDGTALAEVNRNRRSTNTASTIVTRTPTGGSTDGATTIYTNRSGSTGVASKTVSAGGTRGNNEFVLKINTKYVIAVETFADVYVTFEADWYEHVNKNP